MKKLFTAVALIAFSVTMSLGSAGAQTATCPPGSTDPNYCPQVPPVTPPGVPGAPGAGAGGGADLQVGGQQISAKFKVIISGSRILRSNGRFITIRLRGCSIENGVCRYGVRVRTTRKLTPSARKSAYIGSKSVLLLRGRTTTDVTSARVKLSSRAQIVLRRKGRLGVNVAVGGRNVFGARASQTRTMVIVRRGGARP